MQKELSIQDLENIDFNQFKENPSELIQIGKKLMSFNRNDKAIEAFEFGLKTIIAQNNNNEFHIDCAKFNYYYADVLIAKLYESNEIFNNKNLPEEEKKETKENSDTIEEDAINNINPIVSEDTNITDSIIKMTEFNFGAITVVTNSGDIKGVFTDGSLRKLLMEKGRDILNKKLSDLEFKSPICIDGELLLNEANSLFKKTSKSSSSLIFALSNRQG